MSRAFVSEDAAAAEASILPERPVNPGPNLVTPRGLALIDQDIARIESALAAKPDDLARASLARDLRYWRARRASAKVVSHPAGPTEEVVFGSRVTFRQGGRTLAYHIVGQDEADAPNGLLSWRSPLAEALLGARVGEIVETGLGRPPVTVETIRFDKKE
jgi:transcription elongation GreA/GreB family factor